MKYEDFEKQLDEDLSWRKKEVSDILFIAKETGKEVSLKSVILLLYAHWEGYIKKSSKIYIRYVKEKKIKLNELTENFRAISLKSNITNCFNSNDSMTLANELGFINKYIKLSNKKFNVPIDPDQEMDRSIIDTNSNLTPKILKNIYNILGIELKKPIIVRKNYIDYKLINTRNTISHGSKFIKSDDSDFDLTIEDIEDLKEFIFLIIDNFRDELVEFAFSELFRSSKEMERSEYEGKVEEKLESMFTSFEI